MNRDVDFANVEIMPQRLKSSLEVGAQVAELRRVLEREHDMMLLRLLKSEYSMMCALHAEMKMGEKIFKMLLVEGFKY